MSLTLTLKRGGSGTTTGSGTSINLSGTVAGGNIASLNILGDTSQAGTPSPSSQQQIGVVAGVQTITFTDNGSLSYEKTLNLGSVELCKIGAVTDSIHKVDREWYLDKKIAKYVANGSEDWIQSSRTTTNTYVIAVRIGRYYLNLGWSFENRANTLSDYFVFVDHSGTSIPTNNGEYDVSENSSGQANWFFLSFDRSEIDSLDAAKEWLEQHRPVFYFTKLTATDTAIADSALTRQLNSLEDSRTFEGTTTIGVSGNLPSPLEITVNKFVERTYIETELSSPLTISDVEGKSQNTTLNGNVYIDYIYSKKSFTVSLFNLTTEDYADIRAFYDSQFTTGQFPLLSIEELGISSMVVAMEISSRNIVNQCLITDKITLNFRETVQP